MHQCVPFSAFEREQEAGVERKDGNTLLIFSLVVSRLSPPGLDVLVNRIARRGHTISGLQCSAGISSPPQDSF